MFTDSENRSLGSAIYDFHRLRSQAKLQELVSRLSGESNQLLSYDEVRQKLNLSGASERGLKDIPLDAIVGSVGRYTDFTRDFLPLQSIDAERWARVKVAVTGLVGLPPIEVYKIGEVYFVKDGNHRVSVARQLGATHIQAYVTEVYSRVPITSDIRPDDLILKAEYIHFLEHTHLDQLRPDADLSVTIPGQFQVLLDHIDVHRYFMGLDFQRDIPYEEAVSHWYDAVYLPVVQTIRALGILRHFPERTETDLYLWLAEYRAQLEEQMGWKIKLDYAASDLAEKFGKGRESWLDHLGGTLLKLILPDKLEPGPPAGQWRATTLASRLEERLFLDILVPVNGREDGWCALGQALVVAQRDGARIHGLHVVAGEAQKESTWIAEFQAEFNRRCEEAGIASDLVIAAGEIAPHICNLSGANDLIVANLTYPPAPQPLSRLSSGFRDLIQRCPRPLLATPQTVSQFSRALLAYDGSPKAREALYIATYLAGQWGTALNVITIQDNGKISEQTLDQARQYLQDHQVSAEYRIASGPVAESILETAEEHQCDLLIMGGYGLNPVLEAVLGSAVDQVLRHSRKPMLICR
ncbi:MAG: universal stress protein [Chloroflexota bacterium]